MRTGSVIPIIIDNYERFTDLEKKIADYFIYNRRKEDFSTSSMINKLYVSQSSLTRFSQKLGFSGYREFRFRYEEEFMNNLTDRSLNLQEVLNAYNQILNQTMEIVDDDQLERFSNMISDSKNVLVVGIGSSGYAAKEMKSRFMRLGVLMEAIDHQDDMRMQSVFQDENSLVIGMSVSGKKSCVLFTLKNAYKNGAKTVLITENTEDEFDFVDEKILVAKNRGIHTSHEISPQLPILIVIDICYNYFIENERQKAIRKENHKKTLEVLKDHEKPSDKKDE